MSRHATHLLLGCIFGYVLLTLAWNVSIPPYESPDEPAHVQYAKFLAEHARLPDLTVDDAGYEAHHPPLYYTLLAVILRIAGNPNIDVNPTENPEGFLHAGPLMSRQFLPLLRRQALWVHLLRTVSLVAGIVTIIATYASAQRLTQSSYTPLLAASHVAFLPQFTFISASVNNDTWSTALTTLSFFVLVRIATTPKVPTRNYVLLALLIAVAVLTKLNALIMLPLALVVLVWKAESPATAIRNVAITVLVFFAVSGWYFLLNWFNYGDLLGAAIQKALVPTLINEKSLFSYFFFSDFPKLLFKSFLGVFGSMNIHLPNGLYWTYGAIWFASIGGCVSTVKDRFHHQIMPWSIVGGSIFLALMVVVYYNLTFTQAQGRLLFPALAPISILLAAGLSSLALRLSRFKIGLGFILFLTGTNVYALWFLIRVYMT